MLYVTTRDKNDAHTAPRTLAADRGPDGGLYLPFRMPKFHREKLAALCAMSFGQCAAELLNLFFSCRLSAWDVDLCAGRYPVKAASVKRRVVIGEAWHNIEWNYRRMERVLTERIAAAYEMTPVPTSWVRIAIRIVTLFGLYGELLRSGALEADTKFDIAVGCDDFSAPIAVWYAREMGLPVANLICACGDNGAVWDLVHLGEMRTDSNTPVELERLIFGTLGMEETKRYCGVCQSGGIYTLRGDELEKLRSGIFAAVVSKQRAEGLISGLESTTGYVMGPDTALAYGALTDYKAKTGESRTAVILSEKSPICDCELVAGALNVSVEDLKKRL